MKPGINQTNWRLATSELIYLSQVWGQSLSSASGRELTAIIIKVAHRHEKCRHVHEKGLFTNRFRHLN